MVSISREFYDLTSFFRVLFVYLFVWGNGAGGSPHHPVLCFAKNLLLSLVIMSCVNGVELVSLPCITHDNKHFFGQKKPLKKQWDKTESFTWLHLILFIS